MSGGGGPPNTAATDYLDKNDIWTQGPDLPTATRVHSTVAISDHEIYCFGGYPATINHLYDDQTQTFTSGMPAWNFNKMSSGTARITLEGRDVIITLGFEVGKKVEIYDIKAKEWKVREDLDLPFPFFTIPTVVVNNR